MAQPNINANETPAWTVRPTEVKTWLTPETMSPLGRRLMALARETEASDAPASDETAIEEELRHRRGDWEKAQAVLAQAPDKEPDDFDKL